MNNYLCLNKALSLDEYLHRLITYLMYKSDIKKGILATITEFNFKSRLELNKNDNNYFLSFRNIEALKSINGYINVLDNTKDILSKIDEYEKRKLLEIQIPAYHLDLSLFFENNPIDQKHIFQELIDKANLNYVIPFFDNNFYRFLKAITRTYKNQVYYKKFDNFNSLAEALYSTKNITFLDNELNRKLFDFLVLFYELDIEPLNTKHSLTTSLGDVITYSKTLEEYQIQTPTNTTIPIPDKIHTFLVPSFGKECGIAEYHAAQKKGYYDQQNTNGVILTFNRIENLPDSSSLIHIHHEPNFFNGSKLSEENYLELEGFLNTTDKKVNIYFHTIPKWEVIQESYEGKSILRLVNNPNVNTYVYTSGMLKNLAIYPISKEVLEKVKVLELGLYQNSMSIESKIANKICIIGFNTRGKSNNDLVQFLINNTHMEINIIGKGSEVYKKINNPRLWIINDYLDNQQFNNHLKEHANVIICNRAEEATSASASYRLAISLGIPVIASNNIAHTSFFENTKESMDHFLFYKNLEEIPDLISKYQDPEFRNFYEKRCQDLVSKYNIGILTKKLLE